MYSVADLDLALREGRSDHCLQILATLRANEAWSWDLLIRLPGFWKLPGQVADTAYALVLTLADRGVEPKAFAQAALHFLRDDRSPSASQCAARFFDQGIEHWRTPSSWSQVDWSPYCSDLVELLKTTHCDRVLSLLQLALRHGGEDFASSLSTSLFIRWTELSSTVHSKLAEQLEPLAPGLLARSERRQPERQPKSSSAVLALLADAKPPLVMAVGNISPAPDLSTRCLFFHIDEQTLRPLGEAWVRTSEVAALRAALAQRGPIWQARCDAMYATSASRIWIKDPFTYWEDGTRRVFCDGKWLWVGQQRLPIRDLLRVEAYLEQGWVLRGVRLWLRMPGREQAVLISEVEDHISEIDPTYDGLNISLETEWASTLARDLSRALGIPLQKDEAMF